MLTIIFYSTNGPAAKQRAREILAKGKGNYASVYDVSVWDNSPDKCDEVEIMPDVPDWQRRRITEVFGEVEEKIISDEEALLLQQKQQEEDDSKKKMGLMPPRENEKKAVHRGGGRWFVMVGEEIVSGPHEKAEAIRLAELQDEAT